MDEITKKNYLNGEKNLDTHYKPNTSVIIEKSKNKINNTLNSSKENFEQNIDSYNKYTLEKIRIFVSKNQDFFKFFILEHKILCKNNLKYNEIITEYGTDLTLIINDFFNIFKDNIENKIEYQKILNNKGNLLFFEALMRITPKNEDILSFNLGDYLNIHLDLNNTFDIYINILNLVFIDLLNKGIPNTKVSINIELSDILDDRFIQIFLGMQKKYGINITKENNPIILEILENQDIGNDPSSIQNFRNTIIKLKKYGFKIAMDDVISDLIPADKTLENLSYLSVGENSNLVDYVKIDGNFIHNVYKTSPKYINITEIKNDIEKIQQKGISLVFEWIENEEILDFIQKTPNIKNPNFQGFYFNEK